MLEEAGAKLLGAGVMIRIGRVAILVAFASALSLSVREAEAQSASSKLQFAEVAPQDEFAPRRLHRPRTRIRVYPYYEQEGVNPRYYPGPNAVRVCNATYVQEYRPSGTVIVPRMSCYWTR